MGWMSVQELRNKAFRQRKDMGSGWYVMFNVEKCEKCGCEVRDVNACNVFLGNGEVEEFGLEVRNEYLSELGYCENFGGGVCEDCYVGE